MLWLMASTNASGPVISQSPISALTAAIDLYALPMDRLWESHASTASRTFGESKPSGKNRSAVVIGGRACRFPPPGGWGGVALATPEGEDETEDDMPSNRIGSALASLCDCFGIAMALPSPRGLRPHRFFAPSTPASALRRDDSRSFMNSRCIRGWCHLPSVRSANGTITAGFASDHSSGVMRAQRARRRSSSGTLPTGSSRQALHSSSMYAPTCAVDMASTSPSEAKSSG